MDSRVHRFNSIHSTLSSQTQPHLTSGDINLFPNTTTKFNNNILRRFFRAVHRHQTERGHVSHRADTHRTFNRTVQRHRINTFNRTMISRIHQSHRTKFQKRRSRPTPTIISRLQHMVPHRSRTKCRISFVRTHPFTIKYIRRIRLIRSPRIISRSINIQFNNRRFFNTFDVTRINNRATRLHTQRVITGAHRHLLGLNQITTSRRRHHTKFNRYLTSTRTGTDNTTTSGHRFSDRVGFRTRTPVVNDNTHSRVDFRSHGTYRGTTKVASFGTTASSTVHSKQLTPKVATTATKFTERGYGTTTLVLAP